MNGSSPERRMCRERSNREGEGLNRASTDVTAGFCPGDPRIRVQTLAGFSALATTSPAAVWRRIQRLVALVGSFLVGFISINIRRMPEQYPHKRATTLCDLSLPHPLLTILTLTLPNMSGVQSLFRVGRCPIGRRHLVEENLQVVVQVDARCRQPAREDHPHLHDKKILCTSGRKDLSS